MTNRELDRKVAEALGWRRSELFPTALIYVRGKDECQNLPSYSTDIAAAIGALEEFCNAHGRGWELTRFVNPDDKPMCQILKFKTETDPDSGEHFDMVIGRQWELGDTIPLAICNAIIATKDAQ